MVGRIQIQADNVQQLGLKVRIGAEGEGSHSVRLQLRLYQHVVHGAAGQSDFTSQTTDTPAALKLRLLADTLLDPLPDLPFMFDRSTGTRAILEPLQPPARKRSSPFANGYFGNFQSLSNLLIRLSIGRRQYNLASTDQRLRRRTRANQRLQLHTDFRIQFD